MATNPWDDPFERVRLNREAAGLRPEPVFRPLQFGSSGIDVQYGPPPNPTPRSAPEMSTPAGPKPKITMEQVDAKTGRGPRPAAPTAPGGMLSRTLPTLSKVVNNPVTRFAGRILAPVSAAIEGPQALNAVYQATTDRDRTPDFWASELGADIGRYAGSRGQKGPQTETGRAAAEFFSTISSLDKLHDWSKGLGSQAFRQRNPEAAARLDTMRAAATGSAAPVAAPVAAAATAAGPSDADLWNRDMKEREASLAAVRARSQVRPEFSAIGLDDADTARNLRQAEQMRANIANFPEQYTNAQGEVIRPRENAMRSMQEGAYNAGPEISEAQAKQNLAERLAKYEAASRSIQATRAMQAGVPVEAMEATGGNLRKAIAMSQAAAASNLARNARPMPGYGGRGGYGPQAAAAPQGPLTPYTPEGAEFAKAMAGGDPVLAAEMLGAAGRLPKEAQPRNAQELTALMSLYRQFGGMRPNLPGPAAQVPLADFAGVRKEPVKGFFPTIESWMPWGADKRYVAYNRAGQPFDTGVTARDDGFFMGPRVDPQLESLLDPRLRGR